MASRPYTAALFVLYQLSLLAGILLFPLAVLTRRLGVELPVHRVVSRLGSAYDRAA
jgi:hypothetical protein